VLALDVNPKQIGQLYREWYAIPDVVKVRSGAAHEAEWSTAHPPTGVSIHRAAARA
jgi:hypothetical protein